MSFEVKDLKKLMYDFNRVSERLMHTDFADFTQNLNRFISFIDGKEIIKKYIDSAGSPTIDIKNEVNELSHNRGVFDVGDDENSEVANIYCILHYILDNNVNYRALIFWGYSHDSNKWQDMIDGFNSRVTMLLISNIEAYLTGMGYEMGLDQQTKNINNNFYAPVNNIGLQQGDNNTMNNYNNENIDYDKLQSALNEIVKNKNSSDAAFGSDAESIAQKLDQLVELVDKKENPGLVKTLVNDVRGIAVAAGGNLVAAGILALLPQM